MADQNATPNSDDTLSSNTKSPIGSNRSELEEHIPADRKTPPNAAEDAELFAPFIKVYKTILKLWDALEDDNKTNRIVALATICILITTVIYTFYAGRQWLAMLDSNTINKESLEAVQRAFVTFQKINLDAIRTSLQSDERSWVFTAIVENSGTTPAINRIQYFSGSNDLQGEPSEEQFIGPNNDRLIGEIGPKAEKGIGPLIKADSFVLGTFPLSSIGSKEFHEFFRSKRILLWGWVGYRDVFPSTRPHITEFCEEVNGVGAAETHAAIPSTKIDLMQLQPTLNFKECEGHNCTDEHCRDYYAIAAMVPK